VLTNKQTDRQTPLKTSNALRYATTLGKNLAAALHKDVFRSLGGASFSVSLNRHDRIVSDCAFDQRSWLQGTRWLKLVAHLLSIYTRRFSGRATRMRCAILLTCRHYQVHRHSRVITWYGSPLQTT